MFVVGGVFEGVVRCSVGPGSRVLHLGEREFDVLFGPGGVCVGYLV